MSTVTRLSNPEQLHIDEVYEYYDQPCLFTAHDSNEQIFLVVFIDQTDSSSIWLYAPISSTRLKALKTNKIDLKSAFSQAEGNFVYKVKIWRNNSKSKVEEVACQDLTDDQLPIAGEFLDLVDDSSTLTSDDKARLVQEITTKRAKGRDLSRADLSGADLSGADLSGADLSGADLSGADLRRANLSGADLRRANLRRANLSSAKLSRAKLYFADLRRADLRRADLIRAKLNGANLSGAYLNGAYLSVRKSIVRNLSGVNLSSVNLRGRKPIVRNLSGVIVGKAQFGANLGLTEERKLDLKQRGAILDEI